MKIRFPVLSFISFIFRIIGWVAVAIGLSVAIYFGIIEPDSSGLTFEGQNKIWLISGILSIFGGLLAVAFGEAIGVLIAIEENTRKSKEKLPDTQSMEKESPSPPYLEGPNKM